MSARILLFLFVAFLFSCSQSSEKRNYFEFDNDLQKSNLSGSVKSLKQFKSVAGVGFTGIIEKPVLLFSKTYSESGMVIYEESTDDFGELISSITYEYDKNDNAVMLKNTKADGTNQLVSYMEYNENGKPISESGVFSDTIKFHYQFTYNEQGDVILASGVTNGDSTTNSVIYKYDDQGRKLSQLTPDIEELGTFYIYNKKGALVERIDSLGIGGVTKTVYEYDFKGRMESYTFYSDGEIMNRTIYNKSYNKIKTTYFSSEGKPDREMKYEYKFDAKGNWIECRVHVKNYAFEDPKFDLAWIESREIEYYD